MIFMFGFICGLITPWIVHRAIEIMKEYNAFFIDEKDEEVVDEVKEESNEE